jgi:hypothetical protein
LQKDNLSRKITKCRLIKSYNLKFSQRGATI